VHPAGFGDVNLCDRERVPQPILRTARLLMVPLADRHLEREIELDADPEVHRFLTGRTRTPDEVVSSHQRLLAAAERVDGLGHWAAFCSDGGARHPTAPGHEDGGDFVGIMMLPPADGSTVTVAELGYRLMRRFWRQGLATEASRGLLRHAFETAGQERVIAQTMTVNTGSRGVMRAAGLRYVRTFFPLFDDPLPGTELGEVEYEMTREMWRAHHTPA
jgi:RimJ/RimL family protein N-acetyltransferase